MAREVNKLDALTLKALAAGKHFDGGGLFLLVTANSSRLWRMKYRHAGAERTLSFGGFPEVSLKEARTRCDEARRVLRGGIDPMQARKDQRTQDKAGREQVKAGREQVKAEQVRVELDARDSFGAIAEEWLAIQATGWMPSQTAKETIRLRKHLLPWLGALPVRQVGVPELRPVLGRIIAAGHMETAKRVRLMVSAILRFAIATERADRDAAADLRDVVPESDTKHYANIRDPAGVGGLLRAMDGFAGTFPVRCALHLAPLFFCRPGELRGMEWTELEPDHPTGARWVVPPMRRKLKRKKKLHPDTPPHIVPLSKQALSILDGLRPLTGGGRYVFPNVRHPSRPMSDGTINAALSSIGYGAGRMTGHGFRHMARTLLAEMGYPRDVCEAQMSHAVGGVEGIYNMALHLPARHAMMQQWADYLDSLKAGGNVIPLRRKA